MTKLNGWKTSCFLLMLFAAIAIPAHSQTFTKLVSFNGSNGYAPDYVNLVQGLDGYLYGTTSAGGNNKNCYGGTGGCGTVFKLTPSGIKTIYNFCSQPDCTDGTVPYPGLSEGYDGNFYGTTSGGGANNDGGTIFKITPNGELTTLYSFCALPNCADGANPYAGVIQASDGSLYGTTPYGGTGGGYGTVYKLTSKGELTTLFSFNSVNGNQPNNGLIQATDGNLYGTTLNTVFRITLQGKLTTLYNLGNFLSFYDYNTLMQGTDGNLYGTTGEGGSGCNDGCGTIFKIDSKGKFTTQYYFDGDQGEPYTPYGRLLQATDGNFYGTSLFGPGSSPGTVYELTPAGTMTVLYDFNDYNDGVSPRGGLTQHTNGVLYGTTATGGFQGDCCGTIYSMDLGLGPFITFVHSMGTVGQSGPILGQGFTGTTAVTFNGTPASFTVVSDTFIKATVPAGATTGYVTVSTPTGTLTSNVPFHVIP